MYQISIQYIHWIHFDVKILIHLLLRHWSWIQGKAMEAQVKVIFYSFTILNHLTFYIGQDGVGAGCSQAKERKTWSEQNQSYWSRYSSFIVLFDQFDEGIAYNMASSGSYGGNTTTAESARKVYKTVEIRERLVALCPDHYKFTYTQILFNSELNWQQLVCFCSRYIINVFSSTANLILRLMSCSKRLLVDKIG